MMITCLTVNFRIVSLQVTFHKEFRVIGDVTYVSYANDWKVKSQ